LHFGALCYRIDLTQEGGVLLGDCFAFHEPVADRGYRDLHPIVDVTLDLLKQIYLHAGSILDVADASEEGLRGKENLFFIFHMSQKSMHNTL